MVTVDYRKGDYRVVADRLRPAAQQLVDWCAPRAGDVVVDVAAGSGNVSRLCRAAGARVVAVDRVAEQLALGRADGDGIGWVVADAHALPVADGVADAALSTFGVIYAELPEVAVAELGRVCRPGALIGITSWTADGFQAASAELLHDLGGLARGHDHIALWGTADAVGERLDPVADDVEVRSGALVTRAADVDAWWEWRARTSPPIATVREQLGDELFEEFGRRMRAVAAEYGSTDGDGFVLPDSYLLATARVR